MKGVEVGCCSENWHQLAGAGEVATDSGLRHLGVRGA